MNYNQKMTEFRRLAILEILSNCPAYTTNEYDIKAQLKILGQATATDILRADLHWLAEQGLIYHNQPIDLWVVTLTGKGDDVGQGLATIPGVARPEPR